MKQNYRLPLSLEILLVISTPPSWNWESSGLCFGNKEISSNLVFYDYVKPNLNPSVQFFILNHKFIAFLCSSHCENTTSPAPGQ